MQSAMAAPIAKNTVPLRDGSYKKPMETRDRSGFASGKTAAVVLARMDSARLPGKALLRLAGHPLIEHVFRRLQRCKAFDEIVLATTSRSVDADLVGLFEELGGRVYQGTDDEIHNVAKRFVSAAKWVEAKYALRANGDSPFPDPVLIGTSMIHLREQPDLVTNLIDRSYPYGISVEIVNIARLERELANLSEGAQEHVTACFYATPDQFKIARVNACPWTTCLRRLTVDERADLDALERAMKPFQGNLFEADLEAIIAAVNCHESLPALAG
jgi:spore coat polysaccharide biosynthesis protein SpsF (cytidylyltransferase family)